RIPSARSGELRSSRVRRRIKRDVDRGEEREEEIEIRGEGDVIIRKKGVRNGGGNKEVRERRDGDKGRE
ncbi:hypothetical protein GPZ81_34015, partial [Burkholderia pseudomallei]|uniref:hypothetical protein n=1 Tax=Burkholderia pseudomallei TaxID=28450 RepID=UPI001365A125